MADLARRPGGVIGRKRFLLTSHDAGGTIPPMVALAGELSADNYLDLEWALRRVRGEPGPCTYEGSA